MKTTLYPRFYLLQALLLAACLGACGASPDSPGKTPERPSNGDVKASATAVGKSLETPVTKRIGPEGGSLDSSDGTLTVKVPKDAVASEVELSIERIENHAHGKIGPAFRIKPEGTAFEKTVRLQFRFGEDDVLGTAPELLRVASQNKSRFWELHDTVELDEDARTVSVEVEHFSDWSLVTGAQALAAYGQRVSRGEHRDQGRGVRV